MSELNLVLNRFYKGPKYTIGKLYIDGEYFCDTMEDKDRGLTSTMSLEEVRKIKVYGETAIPRGKYRITMKERSSKFGAKSSYRFCNGYLPRLLNVLGFSGILIHAGNTEKDSLGCILVGYNEIKGKVVRSLDTLKKLYKILEEADKNNKTIYIDIY